MPEVQKDCSGCCWRLCLLCLLWFRPSLTLTLIGRIAPNWLPCFYPCLPVIYSQHSSQKILFVCWKSMLECVPHLLKTLQWLLISLSENQSSSMSFLTCFPFSPPQMTSLSLSLPELPFAESAVTTLILWYFSNLLHIYDLGTLYLLSLSWKTLDRAWFPPYFF